MELQHYKCAFTYLGRAGTSLHTAGGGLEGSEIHGTQKKVTSASRLATQKQEAPLSSPPGECELHSPGISSSSWPRPLVLEQHLARTGDARTKIAETLEGRCQHQHST